MKRIGIIAMCFAAVLAFSAVAVSSASALIEYLSSAASGTFTASGGEAKLFGASEVKCLTTTATGSWSDAHLGTVTITFEKCTASGIQCTGSKDTITGNITVPTPFHLNLSRTSSTAEPHAAILALVTPNVSFKCGVLGTVEVRGSVVGLLFKKDGTRMVNGDTFLTAKLVFKSNGTKIQEDKEFLLALTTPPNELMPGTAEKEHLESNIFGGGFKESGEEAEGEIKSVSVAGVHLIEG